MSAGGVADEIPHDDHRKRNSEHPRHDIAHSRTSGASVSKRQARAGRSGVARDALGLEAFEHPAVADEQALDRRVPLKRGHRVVEQLGRGPCGIPARIDSQLVRGVVAVEPELADDGVRVAPERPAQHANLTNICGGGSGGRAEGHRRLYYRKLSTTSIFDAFSRKRPTSSPICVGSSDSPTAV